VDVHVTNGVMTVAREAPNAQVKAEAEQEACSVAGVTRVFDNRQVKAPPSR
jgi:osmotically-inducible protein OsmY